MLLTSPVSILACNKICISFNYSRSVQSAIMMAFSWLNNFFVKPLSFSYAYWCECVTLDQLRIIGVLASDMYVPSI